MEDGSAVIRLIVDDRFAPAERKRLADAAGVVEYWLGQWGDLLRATLSTPVLVTIGVCSGDEPECGSAENGTELVVRLAADLVRAGGPALRFELLLRVLQTVERCGRSTPPAKRMQVRAPVPQTTAAADPDLEFLEADELVLLANWPIGPDGTGLAGFHALDEALAARLHGVAELDDAVGGLSGGQWILRYEGDV